MTDKTPSTAPLDSISIQMESKLNDEQKKILSFVYESAKEFAADILNKPSVSEVMKVTQLMAAIIKMLESLTFNQVKLAGSTKKAVAIELGRNLIHDLVKDETVKAGILTAYDFTADQALETLIDVSRHVNVAVTQAAASCCEFIAEWLKKK
jgi:cobalamin biosynthesis protein CbiD